VWGGTDARVQAVAQAVVAEAATAPFDRTKNLLQLHSELHRLGRLPPAATGTPSRTQHARTQ
jgi:hypothetical protein